MTTWSWAYIRWASGFGLKNRVWHHGDWRDCWWCRSMSRWRNVTSSECVPIPPSCARSIISPQPLVDFLEISSQNSTNDTKESGKVNVHLPFLELVHIVNRSVNELSKSEWLKPLQLLWHIDGDVIIVHYLTTSGLRRTVAQLCGPVPRRHKGWRPQQVEQHVVFNALCILYKYSQNKHDKRT
jgi:hypothetical protein